MKKIKIPKIIKVVGILGLLILAGGSTKKLIDKQLGSLEKDLGKEEEEKKNKKS